jgi:SAM-dependent methyltransferase
VSGTEPDRLRAKGLECYQSGDLAGALAACQELVALEPLNAEALNDLGTVLFALGRVEESVRHYARALELRADYGPAQQNLDMVAQFTGRTVEALIEGIPPKPAPSAPLVTALLLNYKRPQNMQRVLDCLAAQTVPVQVYLWNNGEPLTVRCNGGAEPVPVQQHPLVRLVVTPTSNLRCWPRWLLGSMADTEFLCTLDDDLVLADERVLEDAVRASREKCPDGIVGFFGWRRVPGRSYRKSQHVNGSDEDCWVDLIKGRFMLLRRVLLERVPLLHPVFRATPDYRGRADDIYVNACVSGGRPGAHLVPGVLGKRYVELSECGVALRDEQGHREERDELVSSMFSLHAPQRAAERPLAEARRVERREAPSCAAVPALAAAEPARSGEAPEQLRLLRETPWNVLADTYSADWFKARGHYSKPYHAFAQAVAEVLHPASVLDIGCGAGYLLEGILDAGISCAGVDGSLAALDSQRPDVRAVCQLADLTILPEEALTVAVSGHYLRGCDLSVSIEVAEHVEERSLPAFLFWLSLGRRVLLTAAPPGQRGNQHVNCRPPDYWIGALAAIGYRHNQDLTETWKVAARRLTSGCGWVVRNALCFEKFR